MTQFLHSNSQSYQLFLKYELRVSQFGWTKIGGLIDIAIKNIGLYATDEIGWLGESL